MDQLTVETEDEQHVRLVAAPPFCIEARAQSIDVVIGEFVVDGDRTRELGCKA